MAFDGQLMVKQETTYGAPVVVNFAYPLIGETMKLRQSQLESASRRAGGRQFQSKQASLPIGLGGGGDVVLPAYNRGLGKFLKWMLGAVATAGPADTTAYTHTFTVAALEGLGFTMQPNRPFHTSNAPQPFTYAGCKVMSWSIQVNANAEVTITLTLDCDKVATATALATASYPTDYELLSWAGGNTGLEIGGTEYPCIAWSLSGSNGLKDSDPHLGDPHVEPVKNAYRDIDFAFTADFGDLSLYDIFAATTNPDQYPDSPGMVLTLESPTLITGAAATKPSLTLTLPAPRIDDCAIGNSDLEPSMQVVSGKIRDDLVSSPIQAVYVTADSTP